MREGAGRRKEAASVTASPNRPYYENTSADDGDEDVPDAATPVVQSNRLTATAIIHGM
jgi:hypothetical protein